MRIDTVTASNLLQGQTYKLFNRALETNTTRVVSEKEIVNLLFNDCKDLTSNFRRGNEFTSVGYLSRKYVIEGKPVGLVQVYSDETGSRKIAYIGSTNWGCGALLPANSGIDIFSDSAGSCPLLAMSLIDETSEPYIFLAHVYCNDIDDQVNNIVETLRGKNMTPLEVIFAPHQCSSFTTAKEVLEKFLGKDITFIRRKNNASGLATKDGWSIYENDHLLDNTKLWDLQGNNNSLDNQSQKFTIETCSVPCDSLPFKLHNTDSVQFSSDLSIALVSDGYEIKIFDTKKKEEIFSYNHSESRSRINCATLSPDGSRLIAVIYGGEVKLWDILPEVKAIDCKTRLSYLHGDIKFHPDKSKILVGLYPSNNKPQLIDIETGKVLIGFNEVSYYTSALAINHDGTRAAIGDNQGVVTLFDSQNGNKLMSFKAHHNAVTSISFSNDDSKILTIRNDQFAKIWDAKTGKEIQYVFHKDPIKSAFFNTDGRSILVVSASSGEINLHYPIDL